MKTRIKKKFQLKKVNVASVSITDKIVGGNTAACITGDAKNPKCAQVTNTTNNGTRVEGECYTDPNGACD